MPEDGLLTDFHHRLGLELRFLPDTRAQPAAQDNHLLFPDLFHNYPDHTLSMIARLPRSFSGTAPHIFMATSIPARAMKLKLKILSPSFCERSGAKISK